MTNADRQRAFRERLKAQGLTRAVVWCSPPTARTLAKLKPEALDALVSGALPVTGNAPEAVKAVVTDWRRRVDEAAHRAAQKGQQGPAQSSRWGNAVTLLEALEAAMKDLEATHE